ncbi:Rrf2 family transcriptional regulator [Curvibacter sp. CHRR-16]|uniref:RrF2 family transcriptional regulator n=1 Tax=Curvibacter sp. CHRR-16 TaxID=2835872 RepID=UPI001BDB3B97|nr:Rrf2 family transcriptional regulator [Curvibacter sp. CHRR-16]MBT0570168.1 Rrf2 family transcriptional regulator [Curvibacter sp. CHRR-16]
MRLSTRSRFAITAMMDLALCEQGRPLPLQDIAQRHHISLSYLEQVFARLRQAGLVVSTRGPGGGYSLGDKAADISVADIVLAIEEDPATDSSEAIANLWDDLRGHMLARMKDITLHSLVVDRLQTGAVVQPKRKAAAPKRAAVSRKPRFTGLRIAAPNSVFALASAQSILLR